MSTGTAWTNGCSTSTPTASLSDQFFAASETFHKTRVAYEVRRQDLRELEQELLSYTEDYQALPDQAEYVGEGTWRIFGGTFSAIKYGDSDNCWRYVCNNLSGDGVSFQEASEAVAFLAGHCIADLWHEERQQQAENDALHQAAAEEGGDAIQLTVAT